MTAPRCSRSVHDAPFPLIAAGWLALGQLAEHRLRTRGYLALRDVSCHIEEGALVLRGRVPSFFLKQVAQETVSAIQGPRGLVNQIEVGASPRRPDSGPAPEPPGLGELRTLSVLSDPHGIPQ